MPHNDAVFAGPIPQLYDSLLVPLIFQPYADDMSRRVAALAPARVLETAAGTGVLTRALALALMPSAEIVATDLNPPMLARAAEVGCARPVQWQAADAAALPFDDASFDVVVCQFGVMFFPDKPQAYAQARRVLRPGGTFLFNAWDRIEANDIPCEVTAALARVFPLDPPRFMARTPHSYHDEAQIASDLRAAGFNAAPSIETVARSSRARSPLDAAMAICQGTPLRNEIEARGSVSLGDATAAAAAALAARFGTGAIEGRIQARVVTCRRQT
jgi:ubiquinone/menaquinone biosynthesis C-methylase UbiE